MVFSYVWLLFPFQCGVVTLMLCCCFICSVGLLRSCYVVASSSLCGVVTLMLRCCFLFTVWGCYAYATLLLPFHWGVVTLMLRCCFLFAVGLLRLCYVVASFSLCGVDTLMLRCYFLFAVWGCYAYATLLLPFRCGVGKLCSARNAGWPRRTAEKKCCVADMMGQTSSYRKQRRFWFYCYVQQFLTNETFFGTSRTKRNTL